MSTINIPGSRREVSAAKIEPQVVEERKLVPGKWWAGMGVAWLLLGVYMYTRWIADGDARPAPVGHSKLPSWMSVSLTTAQVLLGAGFVFAIWQWVVKPWRREGRLTFDGMFVIALVSWWLLQDPLAGMIRPTFIYNGALVNLGCPQCKFPGWVAANAQNNAEPIIVLFGFYSILLMLGVVIANRYMLEIKRRHPAIGKVGVILCLLPVMFVADMLFEIPFMMLGLWSYPGSIHSLTIFGGKYYQYPLYEGMFMAFIFSAFASVRFWRNDRGESFAERGINKLQISSARKQWLRLLAIVGIINTLGFTIYHIPMTLFGAHAGTWPKDVLANSYWTHGYCGQGTTFACGDPRVPIATGNSARVTPGGALYAPNGLPNQTIGTS